MLGIYCSAPRGRWLLGILFVASLRAAAGAHPAAAYETSSSFDPVRSAIHIAIAKGNIPSMAVAVSRHGQIIWEEGFGWADREAHTAATAHAIYPLASITKTLTSTGIMVLHERRRIDLDQPVNRYLGAAKVWSPFWESNLATVRRVATHTAGLTTYAESCYPDEPQCSSSPDEMIRHYAFIGWKPGDHFDYSNVGYGVLGEVLAHISGQPFASALRSTVFVPLGMAECVVLPSNKAVASYGPNGQPSAIREDVQKGASSVACSAHALITFAMFSLKDHPTGARPILSDESIDEMQTRTVEAGGGLRYGMGWWIDSIRHGYRVVYGSGGTSDRSALLYLVPSEDLAVVVLMNTGDSEVISGKIADEILSTLLPAYSADFAKPQSAAAAPAAPTPIDQLAKLTGEWTGHVKTYRGERAITLVIERAAARISIGDGALAPAARARFVGGVLLFRSMVSTDLATPDSNRRPHRLGFELYPNDEGFYGAVTAVPLDTARDGAVLSYPVNLQRRP